MEELTVIQHNVIKWTKKRANELYNTYSQISPQIILINATGLKEEESLKLYGYNVHKKNNSNENHSGIAIAVKKNVSYKIHDDSMEDVLAIEVETTRGPVILCTTYIPPRRPTFPYQDLLKHIRKNMPVYIVGDLNARHRCLGHTTDNIMGSALNNLINRNLITHLGPNFKTWIAPMGTGTPDIILCNQKAHLNVSINQGPLTSSDHLPIILKISTKPIVSQGKKSYKIKKANWTKFKETLTVKAEQINLNSHIVNKEFIDNKLLQWHNIMQEAMKSSIPESEITILPFPRETEKIKQLQRHYNHLKTVGENNGWTMVQRNLYKSIQNQLTEEHTKNYHQNWKKVIEDIDLKTNEPREFWANIRRIMGGTQEQILYLKNNQGNKCYEDNDKEKLFREIWEQVFQITPEENRLFCPQKEQMVETFLNNNSHRINQHIYADLQRLNPLCALTKPIEIHHILTVLKSFKDSSPGESKIRKSILENTPKIMFQKMKDIFNLTLSMGYYRNYFKIAMLCLIGKSKKNLTLPINYRPISLLEVTGKIFEKIINNRIVKYLEDNNHFNPNQHGFRRGRGTQTAIATLYEIIAKSQMNNERCNVICRDITKAFDKVWHKGLKYKIFNNFPEIIEKLLCNYLDNRFAKIKVNEHIGPPIPLKSGVPQGGILSPTLFIMFTADMPPPSAGCYNIIFADDSTQVVTYPGKSKLMLARRTEREVEKINKYEQEWKIQTNKNKFQVISVSSTKPINIQIDNQRRPFDRTATILGLTISTYGIKSHIKQRTGRARSQLQKLKRFKQLKSETRIRLYKALIRPILEYPSIPICVSSQTSLREIQRVQNIAIRGAAKEKPNETRSTNQQLHEKFKVEAINTRIYNQAKTTWQKMEILYPELINSLSESVESTPKDHAWWPSTCRFISNPPPEPIFI